MGIEEKTGTKQEALTYEKNMIALKKNSLTLWGEMQKQKKIKENLEKECAKAKDGNDILIIKKAGEVHRMNSLYAPVREAISWAEGVPIGSIEEINILYGLGNGIFVRELLKRMQEGNMLVVFEPSLEIFQFVMKHYDISDILMNSKFCLLVRGMNEKALSKVLEYEFHKVNCSENRIILLPNYVEIFSEEYDELCKQYKSYQKDALAMQNTILYLSAYSMRNVIHNIKHFIRSKSFESLKRKIPKDVTAIMVAAGPSLKENLQMLKKAKGRFLIIAVERVLDILMENGIEPDFIATLDPVKPVTPRMKKGDVHIPAFTLPEASEEFMECHKGYKIICNNGGLYAGLRVRAGLHEGVIVSDGSVATYIFSLLIEMGVKRIVFLGQDLAFGENGAYVDNHGFSNNENPFGEYIQAEGVNGETVYSRQDWMRFAGFFEENIKKHPEIDFVDVKKHGLKIQGTRQMELQDVIEQYSCEKICVSKLIEETEDLFTGESKKCVYKGLLEIREEMIKCKGILEDMISKCEQKDNKEMEAILELSQELEEIGIMKFFNDLIMYRTMKEQNALAGLRDNDNNMLELMKKIFQETWNVISENRKEFDDVLEMDVWN